VGDSGGQCVKCEAIEHATNTYTIAQKTRVNEIKSAHHILSRHGKLAARLCRSACHRNVSGTGQRCGGNVLAATCVTLCQRGNLASVTILVRRVLGVHHSLQFECNSGG